MSECEATRAERNECIVELREVIQCDELHVKGSTAAYECKGCICTNGSSPIREIKILPPSAPPNHDFTHRVTRWFAVSSLETFRPHDTLGFVTFSFFRLAP
jgi:hypothetical protein